MKVEREKKSAEEQKKPMYSMYSVGFLELVMADQKKNDSRPEMPAESYRKFLTERSWKLRKYFRSVPF